MGKDRLLIGVTGRAGAGKTSFARMLAEDRAGLVDADRITWELYTNPVIRKNLEQTFGPGVLDAEEKINRDALANIVFTDAKELKKLNAIIHPILIAELRHRANQSSQRVVILDAALLLDWPLADECNLLIAVLSRFWLKHMEEKGIKPWKARLILANQRPEADFRSRCDVVVENNDTLNQLEDAAQDVWKHNILPLLSP